MKTLILILLIGMGNSILYSQNDFNNWGNGTNSSTAVLLSIQPLPVDAGNLYTGNWVRGLGYSVIQTSLVVGASIMLVNVDWGHHSYYTETDRRGLTDTERTRLHWYAAAYIAVKAISALDAGITANRNSQQLNMSVSMQQTGPVLSLQVNF